ncbi:glycosyltransferase family 2 protein [Pseudaeromonas sharmana]|uniref:Glycosyltransferase family 2 protein n=1 Tax=Pseudaeromonas sharmana TaxID=328412 RepID=A0ABV8CSJ2_9GAMM
MVYVVILNWKGAADTIACVKSVLASEGQNYKIVVCDNASPDSSYDVILNELTSYVQDKSISIVELSKLEAEKQQSSFVDNRLVLIQTGQNYGYAGGNNIGIRYSLNQQDCEYIWILNNDTEVDPSAMVEMVKKFVDPLVGFCGSRLVYYHDRNKLQGLGGVYNPWLGTTSHYFAHADSAQVFDDEEVTRAVSYPIGASIMFRRDFFDRVGLLSEAYFLYYEELDITARAKSIYKFSIATNSKVYHKEGASTNAGKSLTSSYYSLRSRLIFSRKYYHAYYPFVKLSYIFVMLNAIFNANYRKAFIAIRFLFSREGNR